MNVRHPTDGKHKLSRQKNLKEDLLPEFKAPGKPTDEKIAVEYLINQSGRGDLLTISDTDDGNVLPELVMEETGIEECEDETVCRAEDINQIEHYLISLVQ
ncbi:hypothetical protein ACF0H5_001756 [Mactra antiquata]